MRLLSQRYRSDGSLKVCFCYCLIDVALAIFGKTVFFRILSIRIEFFRFSSSGPSLLAPVLRFRPSLQTRILLQRSIDSITVQTEYNLRRSSIDSFDRSADLAYYLVPTLDISDLPVIDRIWIKSKQRQQNGSNSTVLRHGHVGWDRVFLRTHGHCGFDAFWQIDFRSPETALHRYLSPKREFGHMRDAEERGSSATLGRRRLRAWTIRSEESRRGRRRVGLHRRTVLYDQRLIPAEGGTRKFSVWTYGRSCLCAPIRSGIHARSDPADGNHITVWNDDFSILSGYSEVYIRSDLHSMDVLRMYYPSHRSLAPLDRCGWRRRLGSGSRICAVLSEGQRLSEQLDSGKGRGLLIWTMATCFLRYRGYQR